MNLLAKTSLALIALMIVISIILISIGWFVINDIIRTQYRSDMMARLDLIVSEIRHPAETIARWGIDDQDYIRKQQQIVLSRLRQIDLPEGMQLHVIDQDGDMVFAADSIMSKVPDLARQLLARKVGEESIYHRNLTRFGVFETIGQWNWIALLSIDESIMFQRRNQYVAYTSITIVGLMLFMLLLSRAFVLGYIRRIQSMVQCLGEIEQGNLRTRLPETRKRDELAVLQRRINSMIDHIEERTRQREKAEHALSESEEKYRRLIESSNDAIYLLYDNRFEMVNQKFYEIFGVTQDELSRDDFNFLELVSPKSRELIRQRNDKILHHLEVNPTYSFTAVTKDGREIEVEASVSYINYRKGVATQGILRDVTERKLLESQLRQSQKLEAIGTLAGGIAHDFNNILTVILGYTGLMVLEARDNPEISEILNEINKAGKRARDLVHQILAFSRQTEQRRIPIQLAPIVKESLKMIRSSLPATIAIEPDIQSDQYVRGDPTQINQIVMNLCTNAYHAMSDSGGILTCKLSDVSWADVPRNVRMQLRENSYVRMEISDTGEGIPSEVVERIFEPYFTTKEQGKGTGLGLAITHGIVTAYEGMIEVYSTPGQGTTFVVWLPVVTPETAVTEIKSGKNLDILPVKILFIDDETAIAQVQKKTLEKFGHRVTIMTDSAQALELFSSNPDQWDIIISDMTMPGLTGLQLLEKVRQIRQDIPFVLCTGYSEKLNPSGEPPESVFAVLEKPVEIELLNRTIRDAMQSGTEDIRVNEEPV